MAHNDLNEPFIEREDLKKAFIKLFKDVSDDKDVEHEKNKDFEKHIGSVDELLHQHLKVNTRLGLDPNDLKDIEERTKKFGTNKFAEEEIKPFYEFILEALEDAMLRVLIAASIVSLVVGILKEGLATGWIEGTAISSAVLLVVSITSFLNWKKDRQFQNLSKEFKIKSVDVKRNGLKKKIDQEEILAGDLLYLNIGDIIPVDGVLIEGDVSLDVSALNGESKLSKKKVLSEKNSNYASSLITGGSQVKEGEGLMVVCTVGPSSTVGINRELNKAPKDEDTPLQEQLSELADKIGNIGGLMAIFIGVIIIFKEFILRLSYGEPVLDITFAEAIMNAFIISVTVIVVAIPEGLPMAVVISLAYSLQKMKHEKAFVKYLAATETMGNVTNICTDKTGTLTKGEMEVVNVFISERDYPIVYQENDYKLRDDDDSIPSDEKNLINEVVSHNITAYVDSKKDGNMLFTGNMTECALLQFLVKKNLPYVAKDKDTPYLRFPFNSEFKFMASIWQNPNNKNLFRIYVKGAPEKLYERCSYIHTKNGPQTLTSETRQRLENQQERYANQGLRTLLFAMRDIDINDLNGALSNHPEKDLNFYLEIVRNLEFIFLVGIGDAPRNGVAQSVLDCKKAGITVRMVTGDSVNTAISIAREVSILSSKEDIDNANKYLENKKLKLEAKKKDPQFSKFTDENKYPVVIEGPDFFAKSGFEEVNNDGKVEYVLKDVQKFKNLTKNLKVISRASPLDKYILVSGLKEINEIVAVTGDGTNDAPALRKADIGLAMGIRGTDIAKDAADIVLLNDSFTTVVVATKFGRNIYDCIRKFLQFQLTTNVVAVFMTLLGGIVLKDAPLNAIQMLWVNLIMDSFASLALATEPPSDSLLERKPYKKGSSIITTPMLINVASQSIFQIILLTVILFYGDVIFGVPSDRELSHSIWNNQNGYHFTIFFNIFVFLQVFNSLNSKKLKKSEKNVFENISNNPIYILIQVVTVIGQVVIVTIGGRAMRTHPLTLWQHLACGLIASLSLVIGFLAKLLPYEEDDDKTAEEKRELKAKSILTFRGGLRRAQTQMITTGKKMNF
jgi:P-type Ca2+ transporter type 2B